MWVIDIRHWLNESQDGSAVPQLKKKVERLKEIIIFVTSEDANDTYESNVKCGRRPGRKPCPGYLTIEMTNEDEIYWVCPVCSDEGVNATGLKLPIMAGPVTKTVKYWR